MIETGSNQDFVFASTRRRYSVGASALVKDVATWAREAAEVARDKGGTVHEVVVTSGKALLLVTDPEVGRDVVGAVTRKALGAAPGLDVWGYVEDDDDLKANPDRPMARIGALHGRHAAVRFERLGPKGRFPMRPFLEACVVTGLPAVGVSGVKGVEGPVAAVTSAIQRRADAAVTELRRTYKDAIPKDLSSDLTESGWVAVVHADGNGVGSVIASPPPAGLTSAEAIDQFHAFSGALEKATEAAFARAVELTGEWLGEKASGWLVPLIIGGDDVTFVCAGRAALTLTRNYLREFELETGRDPNRDHVQALAPLLRWGKDNPGCLTAAAGIAFVKPHFPYHAAYALAEELAASAKAVKRHAPGRSAYDFHVLHDSVLSGLDDIRDRLNGGGAAGPGKAQRNPGLEEGPGHVVNVGGAAGRAQAQWNLWCGPFVPASGGPSVPASGPFVPESEDQFVAASAVPVVAVSDVPVVPVSEAPVVPGSSGPESGWAADHDDAWLFRNLKLLGGPRDEQAVSRTTLHAVREALLEDASRGGEEATRRTVLRVMAHARKKGAKAKLKGFLDDCWVPPRPSAEEVDPRPATDPSNVAPRTPGKETRLVTRFVALLDAADVAGGGDD
jgi:hypothetical protein